MRKHHTRLGAKPLGFAAVATLAVAAAGTLTSGVAAADPPQLSAAVANGTLFVTGSQDADAITIGLSADQTRLLVDFGGVTAKEAFPRTAFDAIQVSLGNGDDTFGVNAQGQFSTTRLTVDGGQGDDTIGGSRGVDVLIGGEGNDQIRGNDGDDLIIGGAGDDDVDGEHGTDTEVLGAGTDTALWLPGEGNDVIDGGGGQDTLNFIGAAGNETFALTANGARALFTRDLGGIRMDLDSVEIVNLAALGGADRVTVGNLAGTDVHAANLDLSSAGTADGAVDTVTVEATDLPDHVSVVGDGTAVDVSGLHAQTHITGNDRLDQLHVDTAGGNDTVDVTDAAAAQIAVAVDLGTDQH